MGLRISDTYAKIWNIDRKEKYSVVELSVSKKNRTTDQYETDFSSKFVRFVGNAHQQLINMQGNERIKIKSGDVSNHYDKEKRVTYTNYVVFDFELADGSQAKPQTDPDGFMTVPDGVSDEMPFD